MKTVIRAMGCVCALGSNLQEIEHNLYNTTVKPQYTDRINSVYTKEYPVYSVSQDIIKQKQKDESYGFLFLRLAVEQALKQSLIDMRNLKNLRVAVVLGTSVNASFNCFDFYKEYRSGTVSSYKELLNYFEKPLSVSLQKYYGLNGPQMTITTACSSSTDAIGIATQLIEQDLCDMAIAGGTDEINMIPYDGFIRLMIAGKEPCSPFSKDRGGINLGEGAGVFILESNKIASVRNQKPLGYILGYGNCCDAFHPTAPSPDGIGLKNAISKALKEANLTQQDIAFINAHGTGTLNNDSAEAKVFRDLLPNTPVMATKCHTGHTLGAAGGVEAVLTLMALNKHLIPKTTNFKGYDEELKITPILQNTPIINKNYAISNSLAFGGCNSAIVIGGQNA